MILVVFTAEKASQLRKHYRILTKQIWKFNSGTLLNCKDFYLQIDNLLLDYSLYEQIVLNKRKLVFKEK